MSIVEFINLFIESNYNKELLTQFFVPIIGQRKGFDCENYKVKTRDKELNRVIDKLCIKHCRHGIEDVNQTCIAGIVGIIYASENDNRLTNNEIYDMLVMEVSKYYNKNDRDEKVIRIAPKTFETDDIKLSHNFKNLNNNQSTSKDLIRLFRTIDIEKYYGRSKTQRKIAVLVKKGYRNIDIANELGISRQAVKYNLNELARKINDKDLRVKRMLYYKTTKEIRKSKFQKFMDYFQRKFNSKSIGFFFKKALDSNVNIDKLLEVVLNGFNMSEKAIILTSIMRETNYEIADYLSDSLLNECSKHDVDSEICYHTKSMIYVNIDIYNKKVKEDIDRIRDYIKVRK